MDKQNREAAEIIAELEARHRDVLEPVIQRVNDLTVQGDGDGIWYLYTSLVSVIGCIQDLVKSRPIVTQEQIAQAGGDVKKVLN
jgi:hypothetical protein